MKSTFSKVNCPYEIIVDGEKWNASVTILKNEYLICFRSSNTFEPLHIDCENIEGLGETLEDAIEEIKSMMINKKLIK